MSTQTILFFVLVVAVIAIGVKFHVNYGILGLGAAFLLGTFYMGMSASAVINLFPLTVLFNMMNATLFYGFASENGTMEKLASLLVYKFQSVRRFMPMVLFFVSGIISGLGAGAAATCIIVAPIAFGIQRKLGFKPIMATLPVFFGAYAFDLVPWGMDYAWFTSWGSEYIPAEAAYNYGNIYCLYSMTIYFIMTVIFFVVFRGWKADETLKGEIFERPEPMNGKQRLTLAMILAVVALLAVPSIIDTFAPNAVTGWMTRKFSLMPLCSFGIIVLTFAKAADFRSVVVKRVPWDLIIMTCGMGTLFSLAIDIGVVDEFTALLTGITSPVLVSVAMALIGGILSIFLSGLIVLPVFFNMVAPLSAACGLPISALMCAGCMGLDSTSFSPFSQGGALQVSFCPDPDERAKLANTQLIVAFCTLAMVCLFAAVVQFRIGAVY